MISKILFHLYAIYVLVVITVLGLEQIGYHQAMFSVAKAQAVAIITLMQKTLGV